MEHAREYVEAIKGTKGEMCKVNTVRKCKGEFLLYELLGMRGV